MFDLEETDFHQFRGAGGERFVHFVDRLIRGTAAARGLAQAEIQTQQRVNIPDGGVDTQVKRALPNDDTGWFLVPTCWQFKAQDAASIDDKVRNLKQKKSSPKKTNVKKASSKAKDEPSLNDLQKEIRKPFAADLIASGYGYRLCLLGDLAGPKVSDWESQLLKEARLINPNAVPPRVVHGGFLLNWAERFPSIVSWIKHVQQGGFHFEAWKASIDYDTPTYVPNAEWQPASEYISRHVDFATPGVDGVPCLTVSGEAGVGKTRLVCETIGTLKSAASLVVYAKDDHEAKQIARYLANGESRTAILVADECSLDTRLWIDDVLKACTKRVRVVTIYNSSERPASIHPELVLRQRDHKNTEQILLKNFPLVPMERRYQYAKLSEGYIRLAADMCKNDVGSSDINSLIDAVEPYIRNRVGNDRLPIISLIALFNKVGFKDDAIGDVKELARISGTTEAAIAKTVNSIKDSPGFVAQAGRFWYVTPEIVARTLFSEGWRQWVVNGLDAFVSQLPDALQKQFIDRALRLGNPEVRQQTGDFFRSTLSGLTAAHLQRAEDVKLIESVVEAQPDEYLPKLRVAIENCTPAELLAIAGSSVGRLPGPRRTLVWLFERLVSFAEYFGHCEACLFALALNESEPQIGNNATGIWRNLFSIYLSGSSAPFDERFPALERRLQSANSSEVALAFKAVEKALGLAGGNVVGPPVVAGRLRPSVWQPSSLQEQAKCYSLLFAACARQLLSAEEWRRRLAAETLLPRVGSLLQQGLIDEIREVLTVESLEASHARALLHELDDYIHIQEEAKRTLSDAGQQHIRDVKNWADSLRPADFDGLIRAVCSRDPWDPRFRAAEESGESEIDDLAKLVLAEPNRILGHLEWLSEPEASSSFKLGHAIGRLDFQFQIGVLLFEHVLKHGGARFLSGYVSGLEQAGVQLPPEARRLLDLLDEKFPEMAVEVYYYGGDTLDGMNRALRLVEAGRVSPQHLYGFSLGIGRRRLNSSEVVQIVDQFANAPGESSFAGVRFVKTIVDRDAAKELEPLFSSSTFQETLWKLLETSLGFLRARDAYEWIELLRDLWGYDADRAAKLLSRLLLADAVGMEDAVQNALLELSQNAPENVMEHFGAALLDPSDGWKLQVTVHSSLISQLPVDCVLKWVRQHGNDGALRIARHLPAPFADENGTMVVPAITDAVLAEFPNDDVLGNFIAGCHSGEGWWGNASDRFKKEAKQARLLLTHPNPQIRKWASMEADYRMRMADSEDQRESEQDLLN